MAGRFFGYLRWFFWSVAEAVLNVASYIHDSERLPFFKFWFIAFDKKWVARYDLTDPNWRRRVSFIHNTKE